jgi:cytoskeletal protein RodZ
MESKLARLAPFLALCGLLSMFSLSGAIGIDAQRMPVEEQSAQSPDKTNPQDPPASPTPTESPSPSPSPSSSPSPSLSPAPSPTLSPSPTATASPQEPELPPNRTPSPRP